MPRFFNSIRIRITVALVSVVLAGVTSFEFYEYSSAKNEAIAELNVEAEKKVYRLSESLVVPLWEIDNVWAMRVISNEITDKAIYAIIVNADGNLFVGKKRDENWYPISAMDDIKGDYISVEREIRREGEEIGNVKIYMTKKFLLDELQEAALVEFSIALLLGLAGLLVLSVMLNQMVIGPIQQMLKSTEAIASGDYSGEINVSQDDEIGQLGKSINVMEQSIRMREAERDSALASASESESKTRALIENVHTAVLVRDRNTRVTTCNPLAQELFGLSEDQILGKSNFDQGWQFVDEQGLQMDSVDYPASRVLRTGKPVRNATLGIKGSNGQPLIWVLANAEPVFDEKDEISSVIVSFADISPLKVAEEALKEGERRFKKLVQLLPVPLAYVTKEGVFEFFNDRFVETFGYTHEELPTIEQWWELAYPDAEYRKWVMATWEAASQKASEKDEDIQPIEYNVTCKGGEVRTIEISGVFIGDHLLATLLDLTERKQSEAKLQRFSQALEQSGEAIMITDADGIIEHINQAFTNITGYSEEEALGKNPRILKSDQQDARFFERMWSTIEEGHVWQGKLVNRKKSGDLYPAMLSISPIKNTVGEITNFVSVQQNLEQFEALEAQFHQAQKMEAIGTLVGGIAHDFNNALAGITGNLYLAKRKVADLPDVVARLESVEKLSFRAAATIQQLLAFSRKGIVKMAPITIAAFLKEVVKLQQATIPENVTVLLEIEESGMYVKGDVNQLQQVMMNLINNAYDAVAGVDDPSITISLRKFLPDDRFLEGNSELTADEYVAIKVKDNGCGIEQEHLAKIFEPFFTTKDIGKGSGLGLSMVYGTVHSHGGTVNVESEPGVGSEFTFYLPVLESDVAFELASESGEIVMGNCETILFADDNDTVLETGRDVLEGLGYKVLVATDGQEAIDEYRAHEHEIALVILDVVMPRKSGIQALQGIREINPDARVLFATGYDKLSALADKEAIREEAIITKPFAVSKLSQMVKKLLES
ncbi:PAS domain S-box-containing protein [Mariprofundus aestuarium]|uniref:histidine kinase n=1 Tax=Mariprofundus aestuarium TaxID=1921086 RepID=A0A2K8KX55_MARES|nr:PAS domain S-box protein [Mariprofundus aestuarium]ATX79505.1 PAS domain S-box-containing protein [Mariprofundus aestuarium]